MKKRLKDAVGRFIKLYNERAEGWDDDGHKSISEELAGVASEINQLTKNMIEEERK